MINVVLLKPLPYPEPGRIMCVARGFPDFQGRGNSTSIPKFNAWKKNDVFESMAAYDFAGPGMNVGGSDHPEQVKGIHASSRFFRAIRRVARGRQGALRPMRTSPTGLRSR